jgi:hypothetical protein
VGVRSFLLNVGISHLVEDISQSCVEYSRDVCKDYLDFPRLSTKAVDDYGLAVFTCRLGSRTGRD